MTSEHGIVVVQGGLPSKVVWQVELITGVITFALGVVLTFRPSQSLNVVCVFIGVLLIIGGAFHLIRALDHEEHHRAWVITGGLLELVIGVVMIRHLGLTKAFIGLLIGLVWIVQGVIALMAGVLGGRAGTRAWVIAFGVISLMAGIVVVSIPENSVNALALLIGIWFIIMGVLEVGAGFVLRSALGRARS